LTDFAAFAREKATLRTVVVTFKLALITIEGQIGLKASKAHPIRGLPCVEK